VLCRSFGTLIPLVYGRHVLCCRWVQVPIAIRVVGQLEGPAGTPLAGRGGSATVVPLAQPSESPQAREDQQAIDQGLTSAGNEAQAASGTVDPQADSPRAGIELQLDVNLNDVDGVEAGPTVV
jgi:hypothetical protein